MMVTLAVILCLSDCLAIEQLHSLWHGWCLDDCYSNVSLCPWDKNNLTLTVVVSTGSRVTLGDDGQYHTYGMLGPDEYHGNITDSTYGNAIGAAALMSAYELAPIVGKKRNETFRHVAENLHIPYNETADFHPEYNEAQWNAQVVHPNHEHPGSVTIKQADTTLMYYPLAVNASDSVRRNDVRMYSQLQDPHGVAMTWGIQAIVSLDVGDIDEAARYFYNSYKIFARPPFFTWHEGNDTDGSAGQGAPNLVTAAGGFLQSVWAGYGGIRFERDDVLTIRSPRPLPNSTALHLRGVHYLGARLDIIARTGEWTVALSSNSPATAPTLELLLKRDSETYPKTITHTPITQRVGDEAYVKKAAVP